MARSWAPVDANLRILNGNTTAVTADDDNGLADLILEIGSGRFDARLFYDVTAIDITSADEQYDIIVQGSNSATFASGIQELGRMKLGHTSTRKGAISSVIGRYEISFSNEVVNTEYRYLRVLVDVTGTTPSITIRNMWVTLEFGGIA